MRIRILWYVRVFILKANEVEKRCSRCGAVKSLGEFYKNCKAADGLTYYCKACHKSVQLDQYSTNRDVLLARRRANRRDNPIKERARALAYRERNREMLREVSERVYRRFPEQGKAHYKAAWALRDRWRDGYCFHHWNYAEEFHLDVFDLTNTEHMRLHKQMVYDQSVMMYYTRDGELLDTRERHGAYIEFVLNTVYSDSK